MKIKMPVEFKELIGKVLTEIKADEEEISFFVDDGVRYRLYHGQECCESVTVEDVCGEWGDLIGSPILVAEERSQEDKNAYESGTWTFYELATIKGAVTIRWYGGSNGYYSEYVDFEKIE